MFDSVMREAVELARSGQREEAAKAARAVVENDKTYGPAWVLLAQLSDDDQERIEYLERAVASARLEPTSDNQRAAAWAEKRLGQRGSDSEAKATGLSPVLIGVAVLAGVLLLLLIAGGLLVVLPRIGTSASQQVNLTSTQIGQTEQPEANVLAPTLLPTDEEVTTQPTATMPELTSTPEIMPTDAPTNTPEPTSTPYPTSTPNPTNTPRPTSPPPIGTKSNPVPLGSEYRFPGYGTLRVAESRLRPGETGVAVVRLVFECERPSDQACDAMDFMLGAVGGSGTTYQQEFSSAVPEPGFWDFMRSEVYGGGTYEGYSGFLVTKPEEHLFMTVSLFLDLDTPNVFYELF